VSEQNQSFDHHMNSLGPLHPEPDLTCRPNLGLTILPDLRPNLQLAEA
jgi:hypothetical protein